jgi:hypothetical protein
MTDRACPASASIGIGQHAVDVDDSARQNLGALDGRTDGDLRTSSSKAETIFLGMLTTTD